MLAVSGILDELLVPFAQLPANATRYVWRLGVPEPAVLQMMTMTWCLCSWIAAVASFVLLAGVLSCEKARASAFNLFLAGLTVPDLVLNVSSGITFTVNLASPGTAFTGSSGAARCNWQGEFDMSHRKRASPLPRMWQGTARCCTHNLHAASGASRLLQRLKVLNISRCPRRFLSHVWCLGQYLAQCGRGT
jgi:hypothetical protein